MADGSLPHATLDLPARLRGVIGQIAAMVEQEAAAAEVPLPSSVAEGVLGAADLLREEAARAGHRRAAQKLSAAMGLLRSLVDEPAIVEAPAPVAERAAPPAPAEVEAAVPPAPPTLPCPPPDVGPAIAEVDRLRRAIDEFVPTFAGEAPDRQRLRILAWGTAARAAEERHPGRREVARAVSTVIQRLSQLSRTYYPGFVGVLGADARPQHVRELLGVSLSTWANAAPAALEALERHIVEAADRDVDLDGWPDEGAPDPGPVAVAKALEDVRALLARATGTGERVEASTVKAYVQALADAARRLRRLRLYVRDRVAWGTAMGRLRQAAAGADTAPLRRALDPAIPLPPIDGRPRETPAAPVIGTEPLGRELAAATGEALLPAIVRALDQLPTPEVAALIGDRRDEVLALRPAIDAHEDRRVRRRGRALVDALALKAVPAEEAPTAPDEDEEPDLPADPATAALVARVRAAVTGKRAIFVTNRVDTENVSRLELLLGLRVAQFDGSMHRRVQNACESLTSGGADLALVVHGFIGHKAHDALAAAAERARVPFVRVGKGRPAAVVHALARGLLGETR